MKYPQITPQELVQDYIDSNASLQRDFDEELLLKFATDYSHKLNLAAIEQSVERIVLLPVENYSTQYPSDLRQIVQASYLMDYTDPSDRWRITQVVYDNIVDECDLEVNIKCPDCWPEQKKTMDCGECNYSYIEVDVDQIWNNAHPELWFGHMKHYLGTSSTVKDINRSTYHNSFQLMRPATGPYFNMKYHIPTCHNINIDSEVQYRLEQGNKLVVNFEKGMVLLSYLGIPLDDDGNPTIANIPEVYESVGYYLDEKLSWIDYRLSKSREDYSAFQAAKAERIRTMRLAKTRLTQIDIHKFWEDMKQVYRARLSRPYDRTLLGN